MTIEGGVLGVREDGTEMPERFGAQAIVLSLGVAAERAAAGP